MRFLRLIRGAVVDEERVPVLGLGFGAVVGEVDPWVGGAGDEVDAGDS